MKEIIDESIMRLFSNSTRKLPSTYFPWSRLLGHKHHQQPPTLLTCKAVKKFNHRITKPLLTLIL
ncbi:unnamed protein product [Brassica oleracea var. botrytis]|uniref:(rape) hypothetical protein n=1 Tax=Brassica napus TaxID=3708 RepID=A0A816UH81_BRANA|nr:unnamed protein product [Brassica napus]